MRYLTHAAALVTAALFFQPAAHAAQGDFPGITKPTEIVDTITVETLLELATQIGAGDVKIRDRDGKKSVTFLDGDIPHTLWPALCDVEPGKCLGVGMLVIVDNSKSNFSLDALNTANRNTSFLTFFREDGQRFGVGRIGLVDGGVTRRNLGTEIGYFAIEFRSALKQLQTQLTAGLAAPFQRASYGHNYPLRTLAVSSDIAARFSASLEEAYKARRRRR